ncbi:PadR family transcriptional regulator [Deinococcus ruber]|uniref:PadR family transcriptional regulator n=1 Tax=Deinococcus ruber TaxID=1848197 RepID=A0A918F333_9DEIO|nr:PadR family transcriptional regulator [Deinococcus ruber]GGQ96654.1 PadR family transcriptional regulator [Deinococcus ruber]
MDTQLVRGSLDMVLMSVLRSGEMYGLEITKAANLDTGGYFTLNAGSLYPALHRLERAGFLGSSERQPPRGGPAVRYYHLTDAGRAELQRRMDAYTRFDEAVRTLWS